MLDLPDVLVVEFVPDLLVALDVHNALAHAAGARKLVVAHPLEPLALVVVGGLGSGDGLGSGEGLHRHGGVVIAGDDWGFFGQLPDFLIVVVRPRLERLEVLVLPERKGDHTVSAHQHEYL